MQHALLLDRKALARHLGIDGRTIKKFVESGALPGPRVGRFYYLPAVIMAIEAGRGETADHVVNVDRGRVVRDRVHGQRNADFLQGHKLQQTRVAAAFAAHERGQTLRLMPRAGALAAGALADDLPASRLRLRLRHLARSLASTPAVLPPLP